MTNKEPCAVWRIASSYLLIHLTANFVDQDRAGMSPSLLRRSYMAQGCPVKWQLPPENKKKKITLLKFWDCKPHFNANSARPVTITSMSHIAWPWLRNTKTSHCSRFVYNAFWHSCINSLSRAVGAVHSCHIFQFSEGKLLVRRVLTF